MTIKTNRPSRLMAEMAELTSAMHSNGTLDETGYRKITIRQMKRDEAVPMASLSGPEIRALREGAHMTQSVFAKHLNLTVGYVSQLEHGAKHASGPALALLDVIRRKGIDAIL